MAQVIGFILHVVYNKPKRKKSPGESGYAMLFVTKGKKKKFFETKLRRQMNNHYKMFKVLRVKFVSCGGTNW